MVTLRSVLVNNTQDHFNFHILHNNELSMQEINSIITKYPFLEFSNFTINLIDVSMALEAKLFKEKRRGARSAIGYNYLTAIFFKMLLPNLLPNVDKILHLDVDLIVNGDVATLFKIDIKNNLFLGETHNKKDGGNLNVGAIIIDLKKAREQKMQEQMITYLQSNPYSTEEELITILFKDKIQSTNQEIFTSGNYKKIKVWLIIHLKK